MADFKRHLIGAPFPLVATSSTISFVNFVIDAATDKVEWAFQAFDAVAITQVGFRYGARTGTPVQHRIGIQGVDASNGNPDGTWKGGGSAANATFTPPADATWDNTVQWITLSNSYTPARGESLSIVVEPVGTPDGSNNSSFTVYVSALGKVANHFPYSIQNNAGTRTKQTSMPMYGYKTASRTYGNVFQSLLATTFNSGSTPDEKAMRFLLDSGYGDQYKVIGVRLIMTAPGAGGTVKVALYDGTTELQNYTWDTDVVFAVNASYRTIDLLFDEASLSALNFGSEYRVGFAPQSAGGVSIGPFFFTCPSSGDLTAFNGGTDFYVSTRTDSGAWSDDTTSRLLAELIVEEWSEPSVIYTRGDAASVGL